MVSAPGVRLRAAELLPALQAAPRQPPRPEEQLVLARLELQPPRASLPLQADAPSPGVHQPQELALPIRVVWPPPGPLGAWRQSQESGQAHLYPYLPDALPEALPQ